MLRVNFNEVLQGCVFLVERSAQLSNHVLLHTLTGHQSNSTDQSDEGRLEEKVHSLFNYLGFAA